MTVRTVPVNDILDLIASAECYGFADDVLFETLAAWLVTLSDDEIEAYARTFLSAEKKKQGYTKEDYEEVKTCLQHFRLDFLDDSDES